MRVTALSSRAPHSPGSPQTSPPFWLLFPLLSVPTLTLFSSYQGSQISSYPRSHPHRQEFPLVTLPRVFTEIEGWCFGNAPLVIPNPPRELGHPMLILLRVAAVSLVLWGSHLLPWFHCQCPRFSWLCVSLSRLGFSLELQT